MSILYDIRNKVIDNYEVIEDLTKHINRFINSSEFEKISGKDRDAFRVANTSLQKFLESINRALTSDFYWFNSIYENIKNKKIPEIDKITAKAYENDKNLKTIDIRTEHRDNLGDILEAEAPNDKNFDDTIYIGIKITEDGKITLYYYGITDVNIYESPIHPATWDDPAWSEDDEIGEFTIESVDLAEEPLIPFLAEHSISYKEIDYNFLCDLVKKIADDTDIDELDININRIAYKG